MDAFLFASGALLIIAGLHPFLTYPLSLMVIRRFRPPPSQGVAPRTGETYAVCMCAYNEEAVIQEKAMNLLALRQVIPDLQLKIYVDAASDRTAELLEPFRGSIDVHVAQARHGKTHGMNLLVQECTASVLIFTDATVMIDPVGLVALQRHFADPQVGCVEGHIVAGTGAGTATAGTGSLYWRLEEKIKQLEADTGSMVGAHGALFAIRRRLHAPPPDDIIDDFFISLNVLCQGYRVVRAPELVGREETVGSAREEFRRKVRIACQSFNVHRTMWPQVRKLPPLPLYKYLSHKWLRWLSIYLFAAGGVALLAGAMLDFGAIATLLVAIAGLFATVSAQMLGIRPVPQILAILNAFLGTGLGILASLRGRRFQTWTPALSIRTAREFK